MIQNFKEQKEEEIKAKYGDKDYGTEKTKFYGRTNENKKINLNKI